MAPAARRRSTVPANKQVSPGKRSSTRLVSQPSAVISPVSEVAAATRSRGTRAAASAACRSSNRSPGPRDTAATLRWCANAASVALLLRLSGVDVVSVFHKLLRLHAKSRRRFLVPSDMNYGWSLQCTLSWLLMYPHL